LLPDKVVGIEVSALLDAYQEGVGVTVGVDVAVSVLVVVGVFVKVGDDVLVFFGFGIFVSVFVGFGVLVGTFGTHSLDPVRILVEVPRQFAHCRATTVTLYAFPKLYNVSPVFTM